MIVNLLKADFLKIKRKGFWLLASLGAFGVVALQMVNYGIRKDWLLQQSENDWLYYLYNVSSFTAIALVLGITILASLIASIEDETNSWKQLISLPVSKMKIYLSKFTVLAILLFFSSLLLMIFTLGYGIFLDLGDDIPFRILLEKSFYPFLASLPILAFQLWLSLISTNQGIPLTIGVIGTILTFSSALRMPDWVIWKWPLLINQWNEPLINVWLGIILGFLLYFIGMIDFTRRDVK